MSGEVRTWVVGLGEAEQALVTGFASKIESVDFSIRANYSL